MQVIALPSISTARGGDFLAYVLEIQGITVIDYHPSLPLVLLDDPKWTKLDHVREIPDLRACYH